MTEFEGRILETLNVYGQRLATIEERLRDIPTVPHHNNGYKKWLLIGIGLAIGGQLVTEEGLKILKVFLS